MGRSRAGSSAVLPRLRYLTSSPPNSTPHACCCPATTRATELRRGRLNSDNWSGIVRCLCHNGRHGTVQGTASFSTPHLAPRVSLLYRTRRPITAQPLLRTEAVRLDGSPSASINCVAALARPNGQVPLLHPSFKTALLFVLHRPSGAVRSATQFISRFSRTPYKMAQTAESQSVVALLLQPHILPFFLIALVYAAIKIIDRTDVPKIKNLPEVPGVPILGNLAQLGDNHAVNARKMAKKHGPVFQVRLGNRRIVFANTFDSVRNLWITNQSALISRPTLHTFHTIVSSSEGFTIGTSPWDESCKARRKAAATALNRPAVQSYMPIIDYESTKSIKEMLKTTNYGEHDIDPNSYFQRYALSTSLTLNYGIKIEGNVDDSMLQEIVHVEREISNFRSTATNWADYIPLMRLLPGGTDKPLEYKKRRGIYMNRLLGMLKRRIADGTDKPCISGNVLKDPEAKLNDAEVMSIGLTMVSAGLDTVPGNLIMCIAYLSSPHGQEIQKRALEEINSIYPNNDSWEWCLKEEKCEFITALVKETLRYWSVIPVCLPRKSTKDIKWGDAVSVTHLILLAQGST